jgi:hypothetical protein
MLEKACAFIARAFFIDITRAIKEIIESENSTFVILTLSLVTI